MKKTYISPVLTTTAIQLESHLLVDSGSRGVTADPNQTISGTTNFVKEGRNDYDVWNDDWSK